MWSYLNWTKLNWTSNGSFTPDPERHGTAWCHTTPRGNAVPYGVVRRRIRRKKNLYGVRTRSDRFLGRLDQMRGWRVIDNAQSVSYSTAAEADERRKPLSFDRHTLCHRLAYVRRSDVQLQLIHSSTIHYSYRGRNYTRSHLRPLLPSTQICQNLIKY